MPLQSAMLLAAAAVFPLFLLNRGPVSAQPLRAATLAIEGHVMSPLLSPSMPLHVVLHKAKAGKMVAILNLTTRPIVLQPLSSLLRPLLVGPPLLLTPLGIATVTSQLPRTVQHVWQEHSAWSIHLSCAMAPVATGCIHHVWVGSSILSGCAGSTAASPCLLLGCQLRHAKDIGQPVHIAQGS